MPKANKPVSDSVADLKHTTLCSLKEIKLRRTVSNDNEVLITLVTEDVGLLDIAQYPADTLFELTLTPSEYGT